MDVRRFISISVCCALVSRSVAQPAGSCLLQAQISRSQGQTPQEHDDLDILVNKPNQVGLAEALIQSNVHHIESVIASRVEKTLQESDVPADVAANFQAIRDYLNTLRGTLLVEHANDQNATDRLRNLASSCFDTMTKIEVDSRRTLHSQCRVKQGELDGTKTTKCTTFADKKAALPAAPCKLSTATGADPAADAETYLACLHQLNLWSFKVQDLWSAHLDCKNATEVVGNKTQKCDARQTSFEAGFCSLVGACDCHSEHAQAFMSQRTQTEQAEAGRRASFNAAARIECFISVLEGNATLRNETYHDCRALDVNTTHLFIEYDPIPSAGDACTFSSGKPCETTWTNEEYKKASWYTKAPAADCTDCPTTTTKPPLPVPRLLLSEGPKQAGSLNSGLGLFNTQWQGPSTKIEFRWVSSLGEKYAKFRSEVNPFVDRPDVGAPRSRTQKSDNTLIELVDFSTSDTRLDDWVRTAGGAFLCLGSEKGWDTAWAIVPKDNTEWDIGCNSGGWRGRGAFYGEEYYGAGWVGAKDNHEEKAFVRRVVGLNISIVN